MTLVWYKVNDAVGYTVQLFEDSYYQRLFMELETTDPYVTIEDIPYATTFYVRYVPMRPILPTIHSGPLQLLYRGTS